LFKGGTSLSKAFGLIQRFSEDIDITVFREDLGEPISVAELESLSGKKRGAKLDEIRTACQRYLNDELRPELARRLAQSVGASPEAGVEMDVLHPDGQTILVRYPSVLTTDPYIRAAVRIECGAKSALDPPGVVALTPYVAAELPRFGLKIEGVTTILPERTFWDKVIIVHGLRAWDDRRAELRQEGQRVYRHYYDLPMMLPTTPTQALADQTLGRECLRRAAMFFGRPDLDLGSAAAGKFAIMPGNVMVNGLRRDYQAMVGMIFGPVPPSEEVMTSMSLLESRLRR
jgi:hypothetical protein